MDTPTALCNNPHCCCNPNCSCAQRCCGDQGADGDTAANSSELIHDGFTFGMLLGAGAALVNP